MGERTTPMAVEILSRALFTSGQAHTVTAIELPGARATMHLDTIMTMIDRATFVMDPYLDRSLRSWTLTPGEEDTRLAITRNRSLWDKLAAGQATRRQDRHGHGGEGGQQHRRHKPVTAPAARRWPYRRASGGLTAWMRSTVPALSRSVSTTSNPAAWTRGSWRRVKYSPAARTVIRSSSHWAA